MSEQQTEQERQMSLVKECYDAQAADINGREYKFTKLQHKKRRKVFAFFTSVQHQIAQGNFWFTESEEFAQVEEIINNCVLINGSALSKLDEHWDTYPQDYFQFLSIALAVISYPFTAAADGG